MAYSAPQPAEPRRRSAAAVLIAGAAAIVVVHALTCASAFVGLPNLRGDASARDGVIMQYGRDWRNGERVAKRGEFGGGGGGGGALPKKKKKNKDGVEDKTLPKIFSSAPVMYNGAEVGKLNGTLSEYKVDIWSGAHPIWQGKKGKVLLDASSITKFQEKFKSMASIYGSAGIDQLENNEKLKKEQEERAKAGLKMY